MTGTGPLERAGRLADHFGKIVGALLVALGIAGAFYGDQRWAKAQDMQDHEVRLVKVEDALPDINDKLAEIRCLVMGRRWVLGACVAGKPTWTAKGASGGDTAAKAKDP